MRFKWRNALIVFGLYAYVTVTFLAIGGSLAMIVLVVYVAATMLGCSTMISAAQRRRSSNSFEFSRAGATSTLGVEYGSFFHTFESKEPILEALKAALGNAMRGSLGCSEIKFVAFKDIDKDLSTPETRNFLLIDGKESARKSKFHFLANFSREGTIHSVQWWLLVAGDRDPNKVLWRFALAPLTVPFVLLPYIRREYDPLPGLNTVFPGFFNGIDVSTRTRELQFVAFETLVQILDSYHIDISDLKAQRASILNVKVSGGQASFGSIVQGAMNKVSGRAQAAVS